MLTLKELKSSLCAFFEKHKTLLISLPLLLLPHKLSFTYIALTPVLLIWSTATSIKPDKIRTVFHTYWVFILFIAVAAFSSCSGINPFYSLRSLGKLVIFSLSIIMYTESLSRDNWLIAVKVLAVSFSLAALHTLIYRFFPEMRAPSIGEVTQSGQLSLVIPFLTGVAVYLYRVHGNQDRQLRGFLVFACLPLLLITLISNLKRGPWLGVFTALIIFLIIYHRKLILPFIAATALLIASFPPLQQRLADSISHFFISGGRSTIWRIGLELSSRYPLGIGYNNSRVLRNFDPSIPDNLTHFHNNLLNILVENGWIAAFLFIYWLIITLKNSFSSLNISSVVMVCSGLGLLSWQVAGLVEYNFGDSEVLLLAFFVFSFTLNQKLFSTQETEET